jgi:hypothetical protein
MSGRDQKLPDQRAHLNNFQQKTGDITVMLSQDPLGITLEGSGDEWTTEGDNIVLKPQLIPAHYRLTLVPASSSFPLEGVRIFSGSSDQAKVVIPASLVGEVEINLIDDIPPLGLPAVYQISIGINIGSEVHWFEPTISFEPQDPPTQLA